jgi:bacteriorhodopsin
MASGHGIAYHQINKTNSREHVPYAEHQVYHQVYWARYVDWTITTPLLLLDLAQFARISGANIVIAVVADIMMVLTGLLASFGSEQIVHKWGW